MFPSISNAICVSCPSSCKECYSQTNCSSCVSGLTLTDTNQCQPPVQSCNDTNCFYCIGGGSYCLLCNANYYLYNNTCETTCPARTYPFFILCVNCPTNCSSCNSWRCTSCNSGYYLHDGACIDTCPTLTYPDNGECIIDPCIFRNSSNNQCLLCIFPFLLHTTLSGDNYTSECLLECPASTVEIGGYCVNCPSNCLNCYCPSLCY